MIEQNYLLFSIIEGAYIIYMFNFFKTRYSFDIFSLSNLSINFLKRIGVSEKFIKHPINTASYEISHICPFGHFIAWFIALYLILRPYFNIKINSCLNKTLMGILFIGSLMNTNATLYLLPVFISELYFINKWR